MKTAISNNFPDSTVRELRFVGLFSLVLRMRFISFILVFVHGFCVDIGNKMPFASKIWGYSLSEDYWCVTKVTGKGLAWMVDANVHANGSIRALRTARKSKENSGNEMEVRVRKKMLSEWLTWQLSWDEVRSSNFYPAPSPSLQHPPILALVISFCPAGARNSVDTRPAWFWSFNPALMIDVEVFHRQLRGLYGRGRCAR